MVNDKVKGMKSVLSHADYHLDQYTDHNDIIDYYKDEERSGHSSPLNDHTKTGLFRAEVEVVHEQIDEFTDTLKFEIETSPSLTSPTLNNIWMMLTL